MDKNVPEMTSSRPYLVRAVYDWIVANDLTPYVLVDAENEASVVPVEHVNNGKIVLNVSPAAVRILEIGDDQLQFETRFSGKPMTVIVPIQAVLAIYAKENGRGMVFTEEGDGGKPPPDPIRMKTKKPKLRVVK